MLDWAGLRAYLATELAPVPVAGAAAFAALTEASLPRAPALWVVPLRETADANLLIGGLHQRITVTLGVVYVVRQVQDAVGGAANDDLADLRGAVLGALLGWTPALATGAPTADPEPLVYAGGGLLQFANALLFWQDQFTTRYTVRVV